MCVETRTVKTNSVAAWILAARPKTLTAAAVPVLIGVAYAFRDYCVYTESPDGEVFRGFQWLPSLLCLFFAWIMQIDSNFVNDYFDFRHGNDDGEIRLGPKRACAEGWITPKAMQVGILTTTLIGCLVGLPLVIYGGWRMVAVGMMCVAFCFLYTTTFSYLGLGDLLVLLFFGIVPVCCTYYVVLPPMMQSVTMEVFLASVACGLVIDTLLVVNNYRDRDNDRLDGKKTLVIRMGSRNAEIFYLALGIFPSILMITLVLFCSLTVGTHPGGLLLYALYAGMHCLTYLQMRRIHEGRQLNRVLGKTARNIFVYGIVTAVAIVWSVLATMIKYI